MKKVLYITLIAVFALLSCLVATDFSVISIAEEDTGYFTAEEYTNNDELLQADGTLSNLTIEDFANELKANNHNMVEKMSEVVPLEYLESTETNAVFSYNGKEYGFYLVKEGDIFDLLLIDFEYEFGVDLECKISIKPILQYSFGRFLHNGQYRLYPEALFSQGEIRYTYYVANPRFLTIIQNENAYNFGDAGYSKLGDNGLIIAQARTNYGNIQLTTGGDLVQFAGKQILGFLVGKAYPIVGSIMNVTNILGELFQMSQEFTIEANNEVNIVTNPPKSAQLSDQTYPSFTRVAGFVPQNEIVLSEADDSYAEFITVLNESNYRTRMTQICDFDIVRRKTNFGEMEEVPGPEEGKAFSFYKEQTLFAGPTFEIPEDDFESTTPIYLLPHGDQPVTFKPEYSGRYIFEVPAGVEFSVEELSPVTPVNGKYIVQLEGDTTYHIRLKNPSEETILNVLLTCTLEDFTSGMFLSIPSGSEYIIGYTAEKSGVVKIASNQVSCHIKVLDEDLNLVKQPEFNASVCYCELEKGERYYFVITNTATLPLGINPIMTEPESYELDEEVSLALQYEEVYINFTIPAGSYVLTYTDDAEVSYMDCTELVYKVAVDTVEQMGYVYLNTTETKTVSFGFKGAGGTLICLKSWANAYTWEVEGEVTVLDANMIRMKRGAQAEIRLKVGPEYVGLIELKDEGAGYSYGADGVLTIAANCRLTDEADLTTYPGLLAVVGSSTIATLRIQVVHDITSINFTTYNDDLGFEMYYGKVSNVSENATLYFTIETISGNYDRTCTLLARGGKIDIEGILDDIGYDSSASFVFHVREIVLEMGYYSLPIYTNIGGPYQHIHTRIPSMTCNIHFFKGFGTASDPIQISCLRHLNNLRDFTGDGHYFILMRDFTVTNWEPIVDFHGTLDGNGKYFAHTQMNLAVDTNYGIFENNHGTIKNLNVIPRIKSTGIDSSGRRSVGGIVAINYGTISNCTVLSAIGRGNEYYNETTMLVDIYAEAISLYIGAVTGYNFGIVQNCINYASLGGDCFIGGIVGHNTEFVKEKEYYKDLSSTGSATPGLVKGCENWGTLYYHLMHEGGYSMGGIASYGKFGSAIEDCINHGQIVFAIMTIYANNNQPKLGRIVGQMHETAKLIDCEDLGQVRVENSLYSKLGNSNLAHINDGPVGYYADLPYQEQDHPCVAPGTLITLADGTQKPVELLTGNEMLLVWNLFTGTFDTAPILFIDSDPAALCDVIVLTFSDGTQVDVIYEHAFWDFDLNRYVFLRTDAAQYIGHWFNKQTTDAQGQMTWTKVQLTNVAIEERYTTAWSPVTYGHLCYYVNGMLSMPGATEGLINIFEVNEQMKIDEAQMQADIETYGLFTYEEFYELYPVPKTIFEAFNGQYLKISIGKGLLSYEMMGALIERYSEFF